MINVAVEGESDRGAAIAVLGFAGREVGKIVVARGTSRLDPKIVKYNAAARHASWVVFRDSDGRCPVELRRELQAAVPATGWNPGFCLRIAHSMTEAWFLADREGFARFFGVRQSTIPRNPESLRHAKRSLLELCGASTSRGMRRDVVSADGRVGPLYALRLNEFAQGAWDVDAAARNSPSLARAIAAIRRLP